jgi:TraM recognition site of TraD and TraG
MSGLPWLTGDGIPVGTVAGRFFGRTLRLSRRQIQTHMHVMGVTEAGKSRFLAGLFLSLTRCGMPATLIDPDGDLARLVLAHLVAQGVYRDADPAAAGDTNPYHRMLYLDLPAAARAGRFLPFNVLNQASDPHTTARNVLEALRRAWPTLDGGVAPTFENVVLAGSFVLIHHRLPLTLLHDLLVEKPWRDRLLAGVPDPTVVRFFHERYDRWARQQPLLIESTLRRIFLLAFSPVLRYSLALPDNTLDFRALFAQRRSLIVNLALQDGDARRLLGCLLTVSAEQAALARADEPATAPRPSHHLILDEFAEFSAQSEASLARIVSHCRKYGLFLVLAHQTWSQASERLRGALQNAGIDVNFRLGRSDAEHAAPIVGRVNPLSVKHLVADADAAGRTHPVFYHPTEQWETWIQALQDLPLREAFLTRPRAPAVRIRTLTVPDPAVDADELGHVEEVYLARYFRPQVEAEAALAAAHHPAPPTTRLRRLTRE